VLFPRRLDEVATSVCLMGTSAPCDPVTPTVYANLTSVVLKSIPGRDHLLNATFNSGCSSEPVWSGSCGQSELSCRVKPMVTSLFWGYHCRVRFPYGNLFVAISVGRLAVATEPIITTKIAWKAFSTDGG